LQALRKRLDERERAVARHKEAEQAAQQQIIELQERLSETRRKLRQARKPTTNLAVRTKPTARSNEFADLFDLIGSCTSDLIFRVGADGKLLFLSDSCQGLLGLSPEELVGRPLHELLQPRSGKQADRVVQGIPQSKAPAQQQWTWIGKEGRQVPLEVRCRRVRGPSGDVEIVGLARLPGEESNPAPRPWSGSEAWVCSLAHELKQPLAAIINYVSACANLVRNGQLDSEELLPALEQAACQADRAGELIRSLRRIAVPKDLERSPTDINELVNDTVRRLDNEVQSNQVRIELDLAENVPLLQADRIQIGQVLVNLVHNAIEALDGIAADQRVVSITTCSRETEIEVTVRDTGAGLSLELVHRLFEPFKTTKPHGMGLGLALSRAIVQAHGGRLWAKPAVDRGTSFHFSLPIQP
jgi:PAS domain S-box-containing protein